MPSPVIELAARETAATVSPDEGGMLRSLRIGGRELLVPRRGGLHPVPAFGSFVIAPWLAEMYLGQMDFGGRHAQFPLNRGRHALHGLVFDIPWDVVEAEKSAVTLECRLAPPWPFGGTVVQHIALDRDGIDLELEVRADDVAMPAAVGWHPWWAVADPSHIRVRVDAPSEMELDDELIPTGTIRPVGGDTDLREGPILGDRRIDVVYVGARSPAVIDMPDVEVRIKFGPEIEVVTVYTEPGCVCVEPWSAWRDPFRLDALGYPTGTVVVEPGAPLRRSTRWEWTVKDRAGAS